MQDKKNFSFYMPEDFDDKIEILKENTEGLKNLSKSQAVYFLISELASKYCSNSDQEPDSESNF